MTTFNTRNPVPSSAVKDLYDNAENLDRAINGTGPTWYDRLGNARRTVSGFQSDMTKILSDASTQSALILAALGYLPPVAYAAGLLISNGRITVTYNGQTYAAQPGMTPFTTGATFDATKWRLVTGVTLSDLASVVGAALMGFKQDGEGSVLRNADNKFAEMVSLSDYFGDGDRSQDATAAFNKATSYLASLGGGDLLVDFNPYISGAVNVPANVTIRGKNKRGTIVRLTAAAAGFYSLGTYRSNDATDDLRQRITLAHMRIDGTGVALHAIHSRAGSGWLVDNIDIRNTTGEALLAQQMWDSDFRNCHFASGSTTSYAVRFYSGPSDNCNNVRFVGCTFEGCPKGAVVWSGETTTSANSSYSFSFSDCKFENCGNTGDPVLFVESGVLIGLAVTGVGGSVSMEHISSAFFKIAATGAAARRVLIADLYISGRSGLAAAPVLFDLANLREFLVRGIKAAFPTLQGGYYPGVIGADCDQYGFQDVVVNGVQAVVFNSAPTALAFATPREAVTSGSVVASRRRVGTSAWTDSIDSTGNMQIIDAGSASPFLTFNRTSTVKLLRSEQRFACPGTYDKSLVLGSARLWVDSSGKLRIKSGDPTSDTDGTVVGAQVT